MRHHTKAGNETFATMVETTGRALTRKVGRVVGVGRRACNHCYCSLDALRVRSPSSMSQPCDNAFLQQSLGLGTSRSVPSLPPSPPRRKPVFGSDRPLTFPPRPRPQFPLVQAPEADDEDAGSLELARFESAERLRLKWESIYERFKDAHLEDQDEIYLGRANDKIRVIKDRGSLRALHRQLKFGSFMSEKEREALSMSDDWRDVDEEDRNEAMLRKDVDWQRKAPPPRPPPPPLPKPLPPMSSDPDIAFELDIYRSVKRDAIDSLLRSNTLGRATLPYEIPGLESLLCTKDLHTHE